MAASDADCSCTATAPIVRARLLRRFVPLRRPLRWARGTVFTRQIRVLEIEDATGARGCGEASSVDWMVSSPADDGALAELVERVEADRPPPSSLLQWTLASTASPTVRCGLQTALVDLEARRRGEPLASLLGSGDSPRSLPVSALVRDAEPDAMAAETAALAGAGIRSFKVKVGGREPGEDLARARAVRDAAGTGAALRLDANGAWELGEAARALEVLAELSPELVEEPLRDRSLLARLKSPVPVALDESIATLADLDAAVARGAFAWLVLKLERVGGPLPALTLASRAAAAGIRVVVTDSIEGRVGRAAALHVAAAIVARTRCEAAAVGLGGLFVLDEREAACGEVELGAPGHGEVWAA